MSRARHIWRQMVHFSGAAFLALALLPLHMTPGNAQGSAGGTIGKQNKSASGSEEAAPSAPTKRAPRSGNSEASRGSSGFTAASLRGHWVVKTTCYAGADTLSFDIRETSQNEFVGDYGPGGGQITAGQVSGNRVTMTTSSLFTVNWTATVSSSGSTLHMDGGYSPSPPPGNCRFSASKR